MGLYLCVFSGEEELEGVEVGSYADFANCRDTICTLLEEARRGSRFPTLMLHADSDGTWTSSEARKLRVELDAISEELRAHPARQYQSGWQRQVARSLGISPQCLADSFFDVDGEPLLGRLLQLCAVAIERDLPILFQ